VRGQTPELARQEIRGLLIVDNAVLTLTRNHLAANILRQLRSPANR
jgi:hypothetical protein